MLVGDRVGVPKSEKGSELSCRHRTRPCGCENNFVRHARAFWVEGRTVNHIHRSTHVEEALCPGSSVDPD